MLVLSLTCTSKLNIKENFKMWLLCFLERSKYLAYSDHFFDKEMKHFEAGAINIDANRHSRNKFSKKIILRQGDYQRD